MYSFCSCSALRSVLCLFKSAIWLDVFSYSDQRKKGNDGKGSGRMGNGKVGTSRE